MLDSSDCQTSVIFLAVVGGPVAFSAAMVVDHVSDGFVMNLFSMALSLSPYLRARYLECNSNLVWEKYRHDFFLNFFKIFEAGGFGTAV